jgi:ABC-type molybdate transport system permease subunit
VAIVYRSDVPPGRTLFAQRGDPDLHARPGEFGATILFAGNLEGVTQTMPMAIYLGFERNLGIVLALSVVLVLVSMALLMVTKGLEKHESE